MNETHEKELADRLHRELRQLPGYRAPRTLAPRVLAAIAARQQAPWWQKSWAGWPTGVKVLFFATGLVLLSGLVTLGMAVPQFAALTSGVVDSIGGLFTSLRPYYELGNRTFGSLSQTLAAAGPNLMWYLAALVGLAYATCISLGTLGYRLILNRI